MIEHGADLFGVFVQFLLSGKIDWSNGRDTIIGAKGKATRDFLAPENSIFYKPNQATSLNDKRFSELSYCTPSLDCNTYLASELLSGAIAKVLVNKDKKVLTTFMQMFFNVFNSSLNSKSNLQDYKTALLSECENQFVSSKEDTHVCQEIQQSFQSIGL